MTGLSSVRQFTRCIASVMDDTPLADRWDALGDAIERHGRDLETARAAHRDDCLARYGRDIFGEDEK